MTSKSSWHGTLGRVGFIASIGSTLLVLGWRRWTHVLIDFGRELYVPWRLSEGEVLYRDLAYFNGPLSPYLNSVVFRLFGVSYTTLFLFNILLLACVTWLLYRLLSRLADKLTATVGCVLFLIVFALADLTHSGNYNFVTPYSHEMTHATLLSLMILLQLSVYLQRPSQFRLVALGVLLGLVFLTKAEFFLAGVAAVVSALTLESWLEGLGWRGLMSRLVPLTGGLLAPPLLAWLLLLSAMSWVEASRGALGPWPYMFVDELTNLIFYQKGLGTDAPGEHLKKMLTWLGIYACIFGPALITARLVRPTSRARWWEALAVALWTGGLLVFVAPRFDLTDMPRPLPVLLIAAIAVVLYPRFRRTDETTYDWKTITLVAYEVFALVLLAKTALHPRFQNYGFALALPAAMVMVILLLHRIPMSIDTSGGYGPAFRLSGLVFLLLAGLAFLWPSVQAYGGKNLPFGHRADMYKVQDRYVVMQRLLDRLSSLVGPEETMLVLPEGVMLNFQLRRHNPTPHINFLPPELIMFGEDNILAAIKKSPPDFVVLIKLSTAEYGFTTIGEGYGERLMGWVTDHYLIVETIEDPAFWGENFGKALILRGPGP